MKSSSTINTVYELGWIPTQPPKVCHFPLGMNKTVSHFPGRRQGLLFSYHSDLWRQKGRLQNPLRQVSIQVCVYLGVLDLISLTFLSIFQSQMKAGKQENIVTNFKFVSSEFFMFYFIDLQMPSSLVGEGNGTPLQYSFAWKIPLMEKPGRFQSVGLLRIGHD